jgi:hypothetical protein
MKTNNSLQRRITTSILPFERLELNVISIETKTVIFTGTSAEIAKKFNVHKSTVRNAYKSKCKFQKKFAVRIKKINAE